jgi:hypothetical protein
MFRQVIERLRSALILLLISAAGLCLLGATLMIINQIYENKAQIDVLQERAHSDAATRTKIDQAIRAELDDIYKTIYTAPDPKRPPTGIELWQKNRDKELRDRLARLEQWRFRAER